MPISGFTHPHADLLVVPAHDDYPAWARWDNTTGERYTVGVEEEVMLLDPASWSLAQCSDHVLARLSEDLGQHAAPETHAGVVELTTGVHADVAGAVRELRSLRRRFERELHPMGLAAAVAGTHPLCLWEETEVSSAHRYRLLDDSLRVLARREPTMALHVHIGVPAPEDAVKLLNGLRRHAPILLALAGNSPFWQGRDTGFASARAVIFAAFPRTGLPRFFADYADYVRALDGLIGTRAIRDPSFLWWDVRLQPALGTVEVRIMDAQSSTDDVAPIVALIQSLARLELEAVTDAPATATEVLAENRFLAARDGMQARLIDPDAQRLVALPETLSALLDTCHPHAVALGCASALERVPELMAANGADRQRSFVATSGDLSPLVEHLAHRFAARARPPGGPGEGL